MLPAIDLTSKNIKPTIPKGKIITPSGPIKATTKTED